MKKCLIIVDFQNDFVDGTLGFQGVEKLDEILQSKIETYLKNKDDIIFTLDTHQNNYLETQEGKKLPIIHCIEGTKGHQVYGKTENYLKNAVKVFKKETFGSLELGNYLKDKAYNQVEIAGLVTHMCVISNAIIAKAALPEASIIVDRKASMSFDKDLHEKTFELLSGMQIEVI